MACVVRTLAHGPLGPVATTTPYADIKLVQTPTLIVLLLDDLTYRQIHLDRRELPLDANPSRMGHYVRSRAAHDFALPAWSAA